MGEQAIEGLDPDAVFRRHAIAASDVPAPPTFFPAQSHSLLPDSNLTGTREIAATASFEDKTVFRGQFYTLPLTPIFDEDITK